MAEKNKSGERILKVYIHMVALFYVTLVQSQLFLVKLLEGITLRRDVQLTLNVVTEQYG